MQSVVQHFAQTYSEARRKFLDACARRGAQVASFEHPSHKGALGESLAIDAARLGAADARRLLIITSGTHGPEGFSGSGCQVAFLHDDNLLGRITNAGLGLLLVHAVNPYGFSHLRRTNEDNIDLNRNHMDFDRPLPANPGYVAIDPLAIPASWPPTQADQMALMGFVARQGERAFRAALSSGQYEVPDGMFYGGRAPSWSNRTLRAIVRQHGAQAEHIAWLDVHTGLGPYGHGEKIYAGRPDGLVRARQWWGSDVFALAEGTSESAEVSGTLLSIAYDECPQAHTCGLGLEFGTLPELDMLDRLRADHWLHRHPEAGDAQRQVIRAGLRDAFYCDNDEWKGMVAGQTRVAVLQAIEGLKRA